MAFLWRKQKKISLMKIVKINPNNLDISFEF